MPAKRNKPLCLLCGKRPPQRATSAICSWCFGAIEARGEKWCNAGRHVVSRDEYADHACWTCKRATARATSARARARIVCALCQERETQRRSAICQACRAGLTATGRAWCSIGKHVVAVGDIYGHCGYCRACASAMNSAGATCGTCGAPLAGHARCAGCTRLYHGPLPQPELCWLCARDRAAGVPPQGYSLREVAA